MGKLVELQEIKITLPVLNSYPVFVKLYFLFLTVWSRYIQDEIPISILIQIPKIFI